MKFSDIELHSIDQEKVKVLSVEEDNQPEILKELGLAAKVHPIIESNGFVFGDIPFLVHITHLPKKNNEKEPVAKDLTVYASVYERVRKDFAIDLFSLASVETNEIVFPDDSELLNLLQLSFREPAVKQVKHSYLADGSIAEYIVSYKHWKYFKTK